MAARPRRILLNQGLRRTVHQRRLFLPVSTDGFLGLLPARPTRADLGSRMAIRCLGRLLRLLDAGIHPAAASLYSLELLPLLDVLDSIGARPIDPTDAFRTHLAETGKNRRLALMFATGTPRQSIFYPHSSLRS